MSIIPEMAAPLATGCCVIRSDQRVFVRSATFEIAEASAAKRLKHLFPGFKACVRNRASDQSLHASTSSTAIRQSCAGAAHNGPAILERAPGFR